MAMPSALSIGSSHLSPAALSLGRSWSEYNEPNGFAAPRTRVRLVARTSKWKGKGLAIEDGVVVRVREARRPSLESHDGGEPAPIARTPPTRPGAPATGVPQSAPPEYDEGCCFCCDSESITGGGSLSGGGRGRALELDEDAYSSDSSDSSDESGTPSTLPALSPSRTPLFDDSGDEDSGDESGSFPATPRFSFSPLQSRKTFVRTAASTDPLLSPPDESFLRVPDVVVRASPHASTARPAKAQPARLDSHDDESGVPSASSRSLFFVTTVTRSSSPPAPPTSLLTKSLRSLVSLPNLNLTLPALPPILSLPRMRPAPIGYDVEELGGMDDSLWGWHAGRPDATDGWRDERERAAVEPSTSRRRVARRASIEDAGDFLGSWASDGPSDAFVDYEASTAAVQLQTFAPPPSPSRKRTISLPTPPTPAPSAPPPAVPRLISNQRHLLMLSLELSMIHSGKINCPLRQRSVVLRSASRGDAASSLRYEVQPRKARSRQ